MDRAAWQPKRQPHAALEAHRCHYFLAPALPYIAAAAAAAGAGATVYSATKGAPSPAKLTAAIPKPAAPPQAPAPLPPPAAETASVQEAGAETKLRSRRRGHRQTILTNPFGVGSQAPGGTNAPKAVLGQ